MKKKCLIYTMVILVCVVNMACSQDYTDWKTIAIDRVGSFKVPGNWILTQDNELYCFTDKLLTENDCHIYLIWVDSDYEDQDNKTVSSKLFKNIKYDYKWSAVISNGVTYGQDTYEIDGIKKDKYFIVLMGEMRSIKFLAWDGLVDEKTIIKIAKSFVSE